MSSVLVARSLLVLLGASLKHWKGPLKRLVLLWRFLKRILWKRVIGGSETVREGRREEGKTGGSSSAGSMGLLDATGTENETQRTLRPAEPQTMSICESRRPLSALELHLDHTHGQFLQPDDIPLRPASMHIPGQSPVHGGTEMLHPYSYTHSNGSKSSNVSFSVQSHRGRHTEVAQRRPEALPTSHAAARGIIRVASRGPSRSRSRAASPTPLRNTVDLPPAPTAPTTAPNTGSQHTLALPHGEVIDRTPESVPSISLPNAPRENIYPILSIPRYDNYPTITPHRGKLKLSPVTTHFPITNVPPGWETCTHPEGRLYFYHARRHIYTDSDIRDPAILDTIEAFARQIDDMIMEQDLVLPPNHELVLWLEWRHKSGGYNWVYYFVDHDSRSLFWIQELDPIDQLEVNDITELNDPYDIKCELEANYWGHIELYPHGHAIAESVYKELNGMLMFASMDVNTSLTTTLTYRPDEIHRMLGLAKSAKSLGDTDYATAVVGRLMSIWYHNRFFNFYGQTYARIGRDQTIYNTPRAGRTPLIRILSPLFFNAPEVHLRGLERIWIDGIITVIPWSAFIGKLQNEWQEFVLYATVLLNANVAFLAIPSVDSGDGHVTAPQICSYLSIITSTGSILLGLLLVRQHRVKSKDTAEEACRFLNSHKDAMLGVETLAIIYSLPYALLMWGMVTFLIAFSFECFGSPNRVAVFTTAAAWIAVVLLVIWTVYTGWEGGETSVWGLVKERWERVLPFPRQVWNRVFPEQIRERIFPKPLRDRVARPFAMVRASTRTSQERRSGPPTPETDVDRGPEKKWWSCFVSRPFSDASNRPSGETQEGGLPL